ncbi:universal stress protein [Desulfonatronospira sp.]|uniref:universal stress protein n=1 Tax=Desulfonatronospira sp. TaxID=1962951 RepID=UPI0025BA9A37|nr:universal stress protein [Desulfonatronospira sp.]
MLNLNKHFLLAVSDEPSHQYGARFLGYFFQNKSRIRVDLLNIAFNPQKNMATQGDPTPDQISRIKHSSMQKGNLVLQAAHDKLLSYGFSGGSLKSDLKMQTFSTVQDLVSYARKGLYDSLVLGRRGIGMLESLVQDSVSSKLLHQECDLPIWICREPAREKQGVLICTDGSEPSLSVADHVGFALAEEPAHGITVLHVSGNRDETEREHIMNSTLKRLQDNNIQESRITLKGINSSDISGTILDYARQNNFAVIAMGRTERKKPATGLGRFFMGSVSEKVFKNFNHASLWIHH